MSLIYFSPGGVAISINIATYGFDVDFLVQEVNSGPPECKINDVHFELDAERSERYLHKTANL